MAIPRIIHQTYSARNRLRGDLLKNIRLIIKLNPNWEYRFYDDDDVVDFIRNNYSAEVFSAYCRIVPQYGPARADFFRYFLLLKFGGVYLDVKATLTRPLDTCLQNNDVYLLSHWQNKVGEKHEGWGIHPECSSINGEFQQWHIICAPEHPFLRATCRKILQNIDAYDPIKFGTGHMGVLRVTGPIAYTQAITPILSSCEYRIVDIRSECGIEYSIFDRPHSQSGRKNYYKNHYTKEVDSIILPFSPY